MQYAESTTKVTESAIQRMAEQGIAKEWANPRTGKVRHYLNEDALAQIIGLDVEYYGTGRVSGCSYVADGETVTVAHSRAWSGYDKCYIEDGTVYCSWRPYGENIAELVAQAIAAAEQSEAVEAADEQAEAETADPLESYRIPCKGGYSVRLASGRVLTVERGAERGSVTAEIEGGASTELAGQEDGEGVLAWLDSMGEAPADAIAGECIVRCVKSVIDGGSPLATAARVMALRMRQRTGKSE